jgi:pimeloyl-ACP methyl ester carboxylesterase
MTWLQCSLRFAAALLLTCGFAAPLVHAQIGGIKPGNGHPLQGYFFVGGSYADTKAGPMMARQMYVRYQFPAKVTQRYPIVMIHGAAQTGTNFLGTPDGRKGWADFFVERGYAVYVVDQPTRGRSAWLDSVGPLVRFSAAQLEQRFTNAAQHKLWPQAALHTQWPGEGPKKGQRGDPVFDQFYASQVQYIGVNATVEQLNRDAGAALLDKIGPAIVLTHSQSGAVGWVIGDARPKLVKAIVAAEPTGPPFAGAVFDTNRARPYGITETPVAYDPPITDSSQLVAVQQEQADGPNLARCYSQGAPVRKLANLSQMPIAIVASESSYHAVYDHCTAKYLTRAGANATFVRLEEVGIKGNGHMMMIEKNNLEIADFIDKWIAKTVK